MIKKTLQHRKKWGEKDGLAMRNGSKLSPYLGAYTKINSRWIRWLNKKNQAMGRKQSRSNRICQGS
jgi:hypothetical protein